jgi:hypothetical protein
LLVSEDDSRLEQGADTQGKYEEWMAEAKVTAVGSYRMVLEDGPDKCNSESSNEYSDHGDELTGMYTSDMLDEDGRLVWIVQR